MISLYARLQVSPDASPEEIRRAWKRRAFEFHPDRGGDPDLFRAVLEAYETLSDPARRAIYDLLGASKPPPSRSRAACLLQRWHEDHGPRGLSLREVETWAEWAAPELLPDVAAALRTCPKLALGYRMRTRLAVVDVQDGVWTRARVWWVEPSP